MYLSRTVTGYLGRQFLTWFLVAFLAMAAVILLVDTIELLRRTTGRGEVSFAVVALMGVLRLPHLVIQAIPFAVLIGGMMCFFRLTRSHELVVARAAGVSVWQFMLPAVAGAFLIGLCEVAVFNPLSAAALTAFNDIERRHFSGGDALLSVSSTGIWLRQGTADGGADVVHATTAEPKELALSDIIVFRYGAEDHFVGRIDAASAHLRDGYWLLRDAAISGPTTPVQYADEFRLTTDLTPEKIQESFASPETVSFWSLPRFIEVLDATGLSTLEHRMHFQRMLSEPLLLMAMVLIAATFSLRLTRRGGTLILVLAGAFAGFAFFMLTNLVQALGLSASLPVALAAWAPSGICLMLGLSLLMHLEDG